MVTIYTSMIRNFMGCLKSGVVVLCKNISLASKSSIYTNQDSMTKLHSLLSNKTND